MLAPGLVLDECAWLTVEHFFDAVNQLIFKRVRTLREEAVPIDLVTLTQKMDDAGELAVIYEKTGCPGAAYLTDLFTAVPSAANASYYAQILHEKLILRTLINECYQLINRAYGEFKEVMELLVDAQKKLADLAHSKIKKTILHVSDVTPQVADNIEAAYYNRGDIRGLAVGLADFDRMTLGLRGAQYVVAAARPSNGKTIFVTQALANFAKEGLAEKRAVLFFSLEMSAAQIVNRLVCMDVSVNIYRTRDGFISKNKFFDEIAASITKINGLEFYIDDTPGLTIYELRARARRFKEKLGDKLCAIGIDYVQCLKSSSKRAQENRQLEVAEVSMGIKEATKELDIPIIVAAQLNRDAERYASRPKLADLKESGQLEQDADIVTLLHRPDKGNVRLKKKVAEDGEDLTKLEAELNRRQLELVECNFAKQRDGPVGVEALGFKPEYTRFESLTEKLYSSKPSERQQFGGKEGEGLQ